MAVLEIKDLNKKFGGLTVTKDLNMTVQEKQIYGIIGPNGAGKSTLFNQISGYIKPDSGSVIFNGKEVIGKQPFELCKEGMGRTFQIVKPFPDETVLFNVTAGAFNRTSSRKESIAKAEEIIHLVGLEKKRNLLGKNLTIVDRKRLEIAKALATQPTLLLFDEVLAGLVPSEVDEAIELIKQIRESGITILMIEHVMRAVMALCEQVLVISYGETIARGTPDEVTKNEEVIKAYLGSDDHA